MRKYINIINEILRPTLASNSRPINGIKTTVAIEKDLETLFRKIYVTDNEDFKNLHVKLIADHNLELTRKSYPRNIKYRFEIRVPFWEPSGTDTEEGEEKSLMIQHRISKIIDRGEKYYTRGLPGKIHRIFKKYIPDWLPGPIVYYVNIHEFDIISY